MGFASTALRISSGPLVWALHFAVVYGGTALACARGVRDAVAWNVGVATAVAAMLLVAIIVREWRRRARFEGWISAAIAAFALLAVGWEALPLLFVEPCR
jgi:hypothetical protein